MRNPTLAPCHIVLLLVCSCTCVSQRCSTFNRTAAAVRHRRRLLLWTWPRRAVSIMPIYMRAKACCFPQLRPCCCLGARDRCLRQTQVPQSEQGRKTARVQRWYLQNHAESFVACLPETPAAARARLPLLARDSNSSVFTPFFKLFVPSSLPHTKLQLVRSKSTALMSAQTKWRQLATNERLGRPSCALAAGRLVVRSTASSARFCVRHARPGILASVQIEKNTWACALP